MSGTQDENLLAQNFQAHTENAQAESQSGIDETEKEAVENLSASQKMDMLLRGATPKSMKREIEKLRKEAAKHRMVSKVTAEEKAEIELRSQEIQSELEALKTSHRSLSLIRELDKAGCVKSELVAKDIPADCEDVEAFIESYKAENSFLFKTQKNSHGGAFKPSNTVNLTPSQQMDNFIRQALGR